MKKEMKRNVAMFTVMSVVGAIAGAITFVSKSWILFAVMLILFLVGFVGLINLAKEYQKEKEGAESAE